MLGEAAATYQDPATGIYYAWDETIQNYVPAASVPAVQAATFPPELKATLDKNVPGFVGLVNSAIGVGESVFDASLRLMTSMQMSQAQRDLVKVNVERAKRGERPIDISPFTGIPVNIGMTPGTQQLVTYAGIALIGLVLLNMAKRK